MKAPRLSFPLDLTDELYFALKETSAALLALLGGNAVTDAEITALNRARTLLAEIEAAG